MVAEQIDHTEGQTSAALLHHLEGVRTRLVDGETVDLAHLVGGDG